MTTPIPPTPEEWATAYAQEIPRDQMAPKPVADLVPGDAFTARGSVHLVADWPEVLGGMRMVCVPVVGRRDPIEFVSVRQVIAWPGRNHHYGQRRCGDCGFYVDRDHDTTECRMLQQERESKELQDSE